MTARMQFGSQASEAELGINALFKLIFLVGIAAFYHLFMAAIVLKGHQMNPRPFPKLWGHYAIPKQYFGGLFTGILLACTGYDCFVWTFRHLRRCNRTAPLVLIVISFYVLFLGGVVLPENKMDPRPLPKLSENSAVVCSYFSGLFVCITFAGMISSRWSLLISALRGEDFSYFLVKCSVSLVNCSVFS